MDKQTQPPRKSVLGKGIQSLLGDTSEEFTEFKITQPQKIIKRNDWTQSASQNGFLSLRPDQIEANPNQPRKIFDEKKLNELAESLKIDGIIQPIIVITHPKNPEKYLLVAGERRLRAAKIANLKEVPAILKSHIENDLLRIALIENIQRSDLNVIEEALAYEALVTEQGLSHEQCADRVGKDRTTVVNILRLLQLPREIQDDVVSERLSMGHARALLGLEDKKTALRARDIVIKKSLSVRQTEQLVRNFRSGNPVTLNMPKNKADLDYVAQNLRTQFKTKVKLTGNGSKGKIEISYFSASELERIVAMLQVT